MPKPFTKMRPDTSPQILTQTQSDYLIQMQSITAPNLYFTKPLSPTTSHLDKVSLRKIVFKTS